VIPPKHTTYRAAPSPRRVCSIPEAGATYLDLGRSQSYEWAKRGVIPTIALGRKRLVPIAAMERLVGANHGKDETP